MSNRGNNIPILDNYTIQSFKTEQNSQTHISPRFSQIGLGQDNNNFNNNNNQQQQNQFFSSYNNNNNYNYNNSNNNFTQQDGVGGGSFIGQNQNNNNNNNKNNNNNYNPFTKKMTLNNNNQSIFSQQQQQQQQQQNSKDRKINGLFQKNVMTNERNELKYSIQIVKPYNPKKVPPDWLTADRHREATRVGMDRKPRMNKLATYEICPCCDNQIEKEQLSLSDDPLKLLFLGSGYPLYFDFILQCIYTLLAIIFISGGYNLITNYQGNECQIINNNNNNNNNVSNSIQKEPYAQQKCHYDIISKMTYINKPIDQNQIYIQDILDYFTVLVMILMFIIFRRNQIVKDIQCDVLDLTPSDYTIMIKDIPKNITPNALKVFLQDLNVQQRNNQNKSIQSSNNDDHESGSNTEDDSQKLEQIVVTEINYVYVKNHSHVQQLDDEIQKFQQKAKRYNFQSSEQVLNSQMSIIRAQSFQNNNNNNNNSILQVPIQQQQNDSIIDQDLLALEKTLQEIENDPDNFNGYAFVSFMSDKQRDQVLSCGNTEQSFKTFSEFINHMIFSSSLEEYKNLDLDGNKIKICKAPEPLEIIWDNIMTEDKQKRKKRLHSFLYTVFSLIIYTVVIYYLNYQSGEDQNNNNNYHRHPVNSTQNNYNNNTNNTHNHMIYNNYQMQFGNYHGYNYGNNNNNGNGNFGYSNNNKFEKRNNHFQNIQNYNGSFDNQINNDNMSIKDKINNNSNNFKNRKKRNKENMEQYQSDVINKIVQSNDNLQNNNNNENQVKLDRINQQNKTNKQNNLMKQNQDIHNNPIYKQQNTVNNNEDKQNQFSEEQNQTENNAIIQLIIDQFSNLTVSIFMILLNSLVVKNAFEFIVNNECYNTFSLYKINMAQKLSIALFISNALVTTFITIVYSHNIYGNGGLIYIMIFYLALDTLSTCLFEFIDTPGIIKKIKRYYQQQKQKKCELNQAQANELCEMPVHEIEICYAEIINTMYITVFYSPILPVGIILSIFGLTFFYWVQKYTVIQKRTVKQQISIKLSQEMTNSLEIVVAIYPISNAIFHFLSTGHLTILQIISVLFGVIYILIPAELLIKALFKFDDPDQEQQSYHVAYTRFKTTYARLNPVTAEVANTYHYEKFTAHANIIANPGSNNGIQNFSLKSL